MITTLNKIKANSPCNEGWTKLLKHLEKTKPDDEPLSITTILESNGIDDALWCLRAVSGYENEIGLFTVWCARKDQTIPPDCELYEEWAAAAWKATWAEIGGEEWEQALVKFNKGVLT